MFLTKDNLLIRSAGIEDAPFLTAWWNDGTVMAHAGFPKGLGLSVDEVKAQIEFNQNSLSQLCMIEVNRQKIGECNFRLKENIAEIGIKICDVSYQNKGLGSTILKTLIHYLFTDKDLNYSMKVKKIILDTNEKNIRAQHIYEKLGFRKVATNINAWKDQLGVWQTSIDYEMNVDDFNRLHS